MKTRMKVYYLSLVLLLAGSGGVKAQMTVGSEAEPHKGAVLDLKSADKGLLLSNVSLGDVNVLQVVANPTETEKADAKGMVVYNTNASVAGGSGAGIYVWNGSKWMTAGSTHLPETPVVSVTGVSLNKTTTSIPIGSTETLVPTVLPTNATDKSVTWLSSNTTVATVSGGVVTAKAAGTTTITVTTVDGNKPATCSVLVPELGTVIVETASGTLIFKDRNLGAGAGDPYPTSSYNAGTNASPTGYLNGDYYQWGRKADGHEKWNSLVAAGPVSTTDGDGQVPSSDYTYYGKFITNSTSPKDWRSNQLHTLWNGTTGGAGNPCPTGFRVPTREEWESVTSKVLPGELASISYVHGLRVSTAKLFLPAAGARTTADASMNGIGGAGNYWCSSVNLESTKNAEMLHFNDGSAGTFSTARATGCSVRCVKK